MIPPLTRRPDLPPFVVAGPARMPCQQPDPPDDPNRSATKYADPEPWQVGALGAPWLLAEIGSLDLLADRGGDLTAHQAVHLGGTR